MTWLFPFQNVIFILLCIPSNIRIPLFRDFLLVMNSVFFFWQEYATEESQQYKVFGLITDNILSYTDQCFFTIIVILLPLHLASLTHKNPQRQKTIHGMRPIGQKDQSIDLNNIWMCICGNIQPVRVISVAVIWLLSMLISSSLCCALK